MDDKLQNNILDLINSDEPLVKIKKNKPKKNIKNKLKEYSRMSYKDIRELELDLQ